MMVLQVLQLTLSTLSLEDERMVSLVKLLRSVPSLVFDQVNIEPKHWEAIASGLSDTGIRVKKISLNNFQTRPETVEHIMKAVLCVASVSLWCMDMSGDDWALLATTLQGVEHAVGEMVLGNIFLDDNNASSYASCVACVDTVWLSSLGKCGTYTTYSQYPDMNHNIWEYMDQQLGRDCVSQLVYIVSCHNPNYTTT